MVKEYRKIEADKFEPWQAYSYAKLHKNDDNYPYFKELLDIVMAADDKSLLADWVNDVGRCREMILPYENAINNTNNYSIEQDVTWAINTHRDIDECAKSILDHKDNITIDDAKYIIRWAANLQAYNKEMAEIIISLKDPKLALDWAINVGSYLSEMANIVGEYSKDGSIADQWLKKVATNIDEILPAYTKEKTPFDDNWIGNECLLEVLIEYIKDNSQISEQTKDNVFNILLNYGNFQDCAHWIYAGLYDSKKDHYRIKIKILELSSIDSLADAYNYYLEDEYLYDENERMKGRYNEKDFWSDMPDEYKLGILI